MNELTPYIECAKSCGYRLHRTLDLDSEFMAQEWIKLHNPHSYEITEIKLGIYYYEESLKFHRVFLDFLPEFEREIYNKELRNHLIDYINEQ